jgi:hypothetical protein
MTVIEEEKILLLKDLSMRLPYGVKCHFKWGSAEDDITLRCIDNNNGLNVARFEYGWGGRFHVIIDAAYIKPYLRPMSSMTEEEICDFILISDTTLWLGNKRSACILSLEQMDWLNKHHFDYRGLIEKGLALEAPEGMYSIKQ